MGILPVMILTGVESMRDRIRIFAVVWTVTAVSGYLYLASWDGVFEEACASAMQEVEAGRVSAVSPVARTGIERHCGSDTLMAPISAPASVLPPDSGYGHRGRHWR